MKKNSNIIGLTKGDRIFGIVNGILLVLITLLIAYPIYFIIIASFSDPTYVNLGETLFWIKGFHIDGYKKVFEDPDIMSGYWNSIVYMVLGTSINLMVCIPAAFVLSRRELVGRKFINVFFVFTMYFGGGLIPMYLLIQNLGMIDTMWALILPGALNVYNMIVCRSFFDSNISEELFEATKLDGGDYFTFFFKVVLQLSKSIIAVMVLFHALGHWNAYLSALYFLRDSKKFPLQLVLRNLTATLSADMMQDSMTSEAITEKMKVAQTVRYSVIIAASVPVFLMYPLVQKHFVKGVMIGSVKG